MTGRVLDASGQPVAAATVAVESSAGRHPDVAASSTADGGFRLGGLPVGVVVLAARQQGRAGSASVEVVGGATAVVEIRIS